MQIILQEDVEKLGTRGQVVNVAEGYARNFLLPRKLALEASAGNMKRLEKMRATFAKKEATEKDDARSWPNCWRSFARTYAEGRRKRTAFWLGYLGGYFRSAGAKGFSWKNAKSRWPTHQGYRRIRNSRETTPRNCREREVTSKRK